MNVIKRFTFLLATFVLLCSSMPFVQAQDAPSADKKVYLPLAVYGAADSEATVESAQAKLVTRKDISVAEQKAALSFWTHQAIAAAQPVALPAQAGPAAVDAAALVGAKSSGTPGFASAGAATADAVQVAQAAYPLDWAALAEPSQSNAFAEPAGTSQVYDSYIVNRNTAFWQVYPHKWVGRLSFSVPGGTSYCSATAISNNTMVTAAHCVYDSTNNVWYSRWVFSPAYRNGSAPYGSFPATTCWVLTAWINLGGGYAINSWAPYDVAVCKMGKNSAGQTLNGAVGWAGRQWNWPYIRHYFDMGYPFRDYNNATLTDAGLYLRACVAESFQQTTEVRGMGCNWGPGISGGPWLAGYNLDTGNAAVDGVNSGLFIGVQNLYAGRFNSNNIVPLCAANAAAC